MTRFLIAAFLLAAPTAWAADPIQPTDWRLNKDQSYIHFQAVGMGSEVIGRFEKFSGEVVFSKQNLEDSQIKISINTASINTDYPKRDEALRGPVWFDVGQYPTAVFTANTFSETEDDTYIAHGTLALKDVTKDVDVSFTFTTHKNKKAVLEGGTTIQRTAFNIGEGEWKNTSNIKDPVDIMVRISLEAQ